MLVILCGPTGVGRTAIGKQLCEKQGWRNLKWVTTREKRNIDDRIFVSLYEFTQKRERGDFFYDFNFDNANYGLEESSLTDAIEDRDHIWTTDVLPSHIHIYFPLKCVIILIVPDSEHSLLLRLSESGRSSRFVRALEELKFIQNEYLRHPRIDYVQININDALEQCITDLCRLDVKQLLIRRFGETVASLPGWFRAGAFGV